MSPTAGGGLTSTAIAYHLLVGARGRDPVTTRRHQWSRVLWYSAVSLLSMVGAGCAIQVNAAVGRTGGTRVTIIRERRGQTWEDGSSRRLPGVTPGGEVPAGTTPSYSPASRP